MKTTPRDRERKSAQALRSNKMPLGERHFAEGEDELSVEIAVTAPDGTSAVYVFTVVRPAE